MARSPFPAGLFGILRHALRIFSRKGARFLGAAVAFYALLSAAPLFVVVLYVVGSVFGEARAESALWGSLSVWLAPEGLQAVRELTLRLAQIEGSGGLAGTVLVIYGSTRLFRALRRALNDLWGIDLEGIESRRGRVERYGIRYGTAILLTLFVAVLVALLLVVKSGFALVATVGARPPPGVLFAVDLTVSIAFAFVLFTALFRFLPEAEVTWREAGTSALVSTILFAIGSELVTLYVRHKHVGDLYEGAAAVVIAILWVYYSTQVFFLGACVGAALREANAPAGDA
ncbi:MAG: YihY/virulence factor BrkB family protein [Deltaproteobacteria bacterium]|nr:YihY/virulence factor BrkB family protein [Deltaproteobacteria bacterium]